MAHFILHEHITSRGCGGVQWILFLFCQLYLAWQGLCKYDRPGTDIADEMIITFNNSATCYTHDCCHDSLRPSRVSSL